MRYIIFIYILFFHLNINSQNIYDAINYNFSNDLGNSRFTSMGGAFGALGGNLSAISTNPASGAVFELSRAGGSITLENNSMKSNYFNTNNETDRTNIHYQGGMVYVFKNYGSGNLKKFAFGINVQSTNSFSSDLLITGRGDQSIDDFFLNNSLGLSISDLSVNSNESVTGVYRWLGNNYGYYAQQAFLGYQSYLLNYSDTDNNFYSLAKYDNGVNITNEVFSRGFNNKISINLSGLVKDNFHFGFNVNIYEIDLTKDNIHYEDGFDEDSSVRYIDFRNYLYTRGGGLSLQLGMIYKLRNIRIGVSYESPTWFKIEDELEQEIEVQTIDKITNEIYTDIVDPSIINVYEYNYKAPSKLTLSLASIIKNMFILSFDFDNQNYSSSKFGTKNDETYKNLNLALKQNLTAVYNYRFGSEIRLNNLSIRGGFKHSNSPFNDSEIKLNSKSFGIGFQFENSSLDIGFSSNNIKYNHQLFDSGLTNSAEINNSQFRTVISYNLIF
jgi:hypothetical protein